jgi:hypothetical protein
MPSDRTGRSEVAAVWTALIFWFSALYVSGSMAKSLLVGLVVAGCCFLNYGRRWLERAGFLLLVLTMIIFLDLLPPVDTWPASLREAKEGLTTFLR